MSGMMTGITSPARDWFRLTISDSRSAEAGPVKVWLDDTTAKMNSVFLRSNLYSALPNLYAEIGIFGTSAMIIEEDFENVFRCYQVPLGSYCLGLSDKLKVEVFSREFSMTVREIVEKFGRQPDGKIDWSNISEQVKNAFEQHNLTLAFDIIHMITPNEFFDKDRFESKFKKFRSTYYEKGARSESDKDKFLSEKGYDYFPVVTPRWQTTAGDAYATSCPGMEALGDVKQLQLGERRIMQAIDLMVRPPMKAPTKMKQSAAGIIPGNVTYYDESPGGTQFSRLIDVDPRINELVGKQDQVRMRISRMFYEDIFLMISQSDRRQITAREIDERREEKLLALGPVLEQLNQDLLDPLIDIVFDFMLRQEMIEEPPEELQGQNLKVEYISIMQLAQKLSGLSSIERFAQFINTAIAPLTQLNISKVNIDQLIDVYADITSMKAGVVRSDDEVAAIAQAQAQAQAQQQQAQAALQMSQMTKNLAQSPASEDNVLGQMKAQNEAGALV